MVTVKKYPIVFSFRDPIIGNGFVANVEMDGRALLTVEEDGDCWIYGVQPGGVAGGDPDQAAALQAFKKNYYSVLYDIAAEEDSFDGFERAVQAFFAEVCTDTTAEWKAALESQRTGGAEKPAQLPCVKAETRPPKVQVVKLDPQTAKPSHNQFDNIFLARKAA